MTKDDALRHASYAIRNWMLLYPDDIDALDRRAMDAINEALEQPAQQPLTDAEIDAVTVECFGLNADLEFHPIITDDRIGPASSSGGKATAC